MLLLSSTRSAAFPRTNTKNVRDLGLGEQMSGQSRADDELCEEYHPILPLPSSVMLILRPLESSSHCCGGSEGFGSGGKPLPVLEAELNCRKDSRGRRRRFDRAIDSSVRPFPCILLLLPRAHHARPAVRVIESRSTSYHVGNQGCRRKSNTEDFLVGG